MKEPSVILCCNPKFVCFQGSASDPAGRAYDAPPYPLVDWGSP